MSTHTEDRLSALLSAPVSMSPRVHGERVFFASDLLGPMSLFSMPLAGGEPRALLPPDIALQNPALLYGTPLFAILPDGGRILLALDRHGDEHYQPHVIPLDGGVPQPLFPERSPADSLMLLAVENATAYFLAERSASRDSEILATDLRTLATESCWAGALLAQFVCVGPSGSFLILCDRYGYGDDVLYRWDRETRSRRPLAGIPKDGRGAPSFRGRTFAFDRPIAVGDGSTLFLRSTVFSDCHTPCLLEMDGSLREVRVHGTTHRSVGELHRVQRANDGEFFLEFNSDGCSHGYLGALDLEEALFRVTAKVCGEGELAGGVLQGIDFASEPGHPTPAPSRGACRAVLSYSSATRPSTLFRLDRGREAHPVALTGTAASRVPRAELSAGEDASFASFDGLRISARLYRPAPALRHAGPRPLVVYIHGGPQSQERPDFTWFSMPLIQHLTMRGFAVFVPNIRGSSGYGIEYMRKVHKDWGGEDLRDLVSGIEALEGDPGIDATRRGAVGRSYGGFMTMNLLARHPGLLRAGVNLFGMCSLIDMTENAPLAVAEYLRQEVGDLADEAERRKMSEHSAATHFTRIRAPVLFVQGMRDPRALAHLTLRYAKMLQEMGKEVDLLLFEDEGHDILKRENKAQCFERIGEFFARWLQA